MYQYIYICIHINIYKYTCDRVSKNLHALLRHDVHPHNLLVPLSLHCAWMRVEGLRFGVEG